MIPIQGSVVKNDLKKFGPCIQAGIEISVPVLTMWEANKYLDGLKGKLSSRYIAVTYTDSQYNARNPKRDLTTILTNEQMAACVII